VTLRALDAAWLCSLLTDSFRGRRKSEREPTIDRHEDDRVKPAGVGLNRHNDHEDVYDDKKDHRNDGEDTSDTCPMKVAAPDEDEKEPAQTHEKAERLRREEGPVRRSQTLGVDERPVKPVDREAADSKEHR